MFASKYLNATMDVQWSKSPMLGRLSGIKLLPEQAAVETLIDPVKMIPEDEVASAHNQVVVHCDVNDPSYFFQAAFVHSSVGVG